MFAPPNAQRNIQDFLHGQRHAMIILGLTTSLSSSFRCYFIVYIIQNDVLWNYYPCVISILSAIPFRNEETQSQKSQIIYQKSHSKLDQFRF